MICQYWFFNYGFKFQDSVCNVCHDLTVQFFNTSGTAIILLKVLIIVALFIIFANLKQLICQEFLQLKIIGIYEKYCPIFGLAY